MTRCRCSVIHWRDDGNEPYTPAFAERNQGAGDVSVRCEGFCIKNALRKMKNLARFKTILMCALVLTLHILH